MGTHCLRMLSYKIHRRPRNFHHLFSEINFWPKWCSTGEWGLNLLASHKRSYANHFNFLNKLCLIISSFYCWYTASGANVLNSAHGTRYHRAKHKRRNSSGQYDVQGESYNASPTPFNRIAEFLFESL